MKRVILFSLMALMTVAAFGRKHVENATVVADTIYYAENMSNVASADQLLQTADDYWHWHQ